MPLFKKIIIIFSVVVLVLFIALVIAAWILGTFASVKIEHADRGPYGMVILAQPDSYQNIAHIMTEEDCLETNCGDEYTNGATGSIESMKFLTRTSD